MNAPSRASFEDRLLVELRALVAERPAPTVAHRPRPRRTRIGLAVAGGAAAATVAAVALVAGSGDRPSNAYAVERLADGAVSVSINSLSDADGLERKLREAGVPAVVDYDPTGGPGCVGAESAAGADRSGKATTGPSVESHNDAGTAAAPSLSTSGGEAPGGSGKATTRISHTGDGIAFTIDPGDLRPGEEVYITTATGSVSTVAMAIAKDKPPVACPEP